MEHSYFNLMLYLFQEDCKQPEGYKVGLLNIHMIQDKTTCQKWYFLFYNLASVPDTNVAYSYLHENNKKSCYSCWEDPDLKWKEDFPDAKLLTSVKKI
jgi:hypothetical protein